MSCTESETVINHPVMLHRCRECLQSWCQSWWTSFCSLDSPPDWQRWALCQCEQNRTPTQPSESLFTPKNIHKTAFCIGTLQRWGEMGRCRDRLWPALVRFVWILINPRSLEQHCWNRPSLWSHPPCLSSWLLQAEQTQYLLLNLPFCPPAVSQNQPQHLPHSSSLCTGPARTSSGLFAL